MKIQYPLTVADLNAFARYWSSLRAPHQKKRYTVVPLALLLAAGLTILLFPSGMLDISRGEVLVAVLPPLLIFATLCLLGTLIHRHTLRRAMAGDYHVEFGEESIRHGEDGTTADTRWEALRQVAEQSTHLFLVYGYQKAIIIPRRAVDEAQLDQIRELIRRHRPELAQR